MRRTNKTELETIEWLARIRWPNGVKCPSCASRDVSGLVVSRGIWQCRSCRGQFGIFKGTRFEGTRLSPIRLAELIIHYFKDSLENYERVWASKEAIKSGKISHRWRGPIGVRAFQKYVTTYSTAQRIHKKLRAVKFDENMKLDEFIFRLLS